MHTLDVVKRILIEYKRIFNCLEYMHEQKGFPALLHAQVIVQHNSAVKFICGDTRAICTSKTH